MVHAMQLVRSLASSQLESESTELKLQVGSTVTVIHAPSGRKLRAGDPNGHGQSSVELAASSSADSDTACHWVVEQVASAVALKSLKYGTHLHVPVDQKTAGSAVVLSAKTDIGSQWAVEASGSAIVLKSLRSGLRLHGEADAKADAGSTGSRLNVGDVVRVRAGT
jgi:hypothetical protein